MTRCEKRGGHQFHVTPAPGWFQCGRAVDYKATSGKMVYCGQLAVCPGCVGFVYVCLPVLFCEVHQSCRLEDFEMVACVNDTASVGVEHVSHEQASLW